ncbi:MAG: radical SAM protein [Candidatus Caldatribacteriaceae bacterium]
MMEEAFAETTCLVCGRRSIFIASFLGVCRDCIAQNFAQAWPFIREAHNTARKYLHEPPAPPRGKTACTLCIHRCGEEGKSFCGLLENGKRWAGSSRKGLCQWYSDPLPTNCVASFVCPEREHRGYENLAIFYGGCHFDCLFCQNWHHHHLLKEEPALLSVEELVKAIHARVACICFFGGDPIPQVGHALALSRKVKGRVRICWETNGAVHPEILKKMLAVSRESGGILKFDLKAFDEGLHLALTGVSNRLTFQNFAWAATEAQKFPQVTVVASTLLVPGYVTEEEVEKIASFIASLNPEIPYALLGFAPNFFMEDLPPTSIHHAEEALKRCRERGLRSVHLGNRFLLSRVY